MKYPEKKPKWHGKKKSGGKETTNVEIMIANVEEPDFA